MIARILTICICLLISSCASFYDEKVSPGRIMRGNLDEGISQIEKTCKGMGYKSCSAGDLEIIGHGAGSYRYYPMNIHEDRYVYGNKWSGKCKSQAKNISELMDEFFKNDKVSSIEIDVQAPKEDHILCRKGENCLFVMHDKPNWGNITSLSSPAVKYLKQNTLRKTLDHFVANNYKKDKNIYIELKSKFNCNAPNREDEKCRSLGRRVAKEIESYIGDSVSENNIKNWITIVSFSATSLQSFRETLKEAKKDMVDYALIAGVHPFSMKWFLGQLKGSVPFFDKDLQQFLITQHWVDLVWFSPQGISDYSVLFKSLNDNRRYKCTVNGEKCKPLEFSVATYPFKNDEFYEKMTQVIPAFDQYMASMMIDVDDVAECR